MLINYTHFPSSQLFLRVFDSAQSQWKSNEMLIRTTNMQQEYDATITCTYFSVSDTSVRQSLLREERKSAWNSSLKRQLDEKINRMQMLPRQKCHGLWIFVLWLLSAIFYFPLTYSVEYFFLSCVTSCFYCWSALTYFQSPHHFLCTYTDQS